jgi:hypothetical protein
MEIQSAYPQPPVVSSLPLFTPAKRWRVFTLRRDGNVLHVRPDPGARVTAFVAGVAITVVVGFLIMMVFAASYEGPPPNLYLRYGLWALAAATVVAVGVFFNFTGGASADVLFDKGTGVLRGRGWMRGRWRRGLACALADVASLQVCCRHVDVEEGEDYQTFELNVVLDQPPGERLGLGSHADSREVMQDAYTLATFLGCGILNDCPSLQEFPRAGYLPYVRTTTTKA